MSTQIPRRIWIWLGLTGLLLWAWVTATAGYHVVYVFEITALNVLACGVQRVPYVVTGFALVWLMVFTGLRHYRQLTEKGFYIAFAALLIISTFALWLYADWSMDVHREFNRYTILIDRRPADAKSVLAELGALGRGSVSGAGGVDVFPIDHTRLIRAHDRLAARGYEVRYKDTGLAQDIMVRYIRPYEDEPP